MTITVPPLSNKNQYLTNTAIQQIAKQVNNLPNIYINAKDYGAVGDGVTDDTAALQQAGNAAIAANVPLYIPGTTNGFLVNQNGSNNYCLQFTSPIQIIAGPGLGIIRPSASVPNTVDIIQLIGSSNTYIRTVISGLMIGNPSSGTRTGRHAINFSSTGPTQQLFLRPIVRDCYLQDSGNATCNSISVTNSTAVNSNGGFAYALIDNNFIGSGISLNGAGDSIKVSHNILTGSTTAPGIYANLITNAGNLQVIGNNGGINACCADIGYADTFDIIDNEFEHNNTGATGALINVSGAVQRIPGGTVTNNELTILQGTNVNHPLCLNIDTADGIYVNANKFAPYTAYAPVTFTANAGTVSGGCFMGAGNFWPTSSTLRLTDNATTTIYEKSTILYGHTAHASTLTGGTTGFVGLSDLNTTEAFIYMRAPYPTCVMKNFEIYFGNGAPGAGQTYTCTVMKNGSTTTITGTVSSSASNSAGDITHQASYTQGDLFSIKVVPSAGAATAQDIQWTLEACQY